MERAEILAKAKELGIDHQKNIQTAKLVEKIETVTGESLGYEPKPDSNITTADLKGAGETKLNTKKGDKTIRVVIHSGDKDNDETEMVGCVNGEPFQCQIGVEIDLPVKFLPAFDGAIIERHVHKFDEDGNPLKGTTIKKEKLYIVERV